MDLLPQNYRNNLLSGIEAAHILQVSFATIFLFSSKLQLKLRKGGEGEGLGVVVTFSQPSFSAFLFSCTINQELTSSVYFVPNHSLKC